MRIEVHGAPIKRKDVPKPNLFPIQKVAATFQSEQVPKQTHMSQAVSQQHFAEGLETASIWSANASKAQKSTGPVDFITPKTLKPQAFVTSQERRQRKQGLNNKQPLTNEETPSDP